MSSSENSENLAIQASTEKSAIDPGASQRRIDANRRNALQSTGPKTPRGKDIAARNSLRHGLLAKSAVIRLGPVKESQAEFDELLRGLHDYFAPVGMAEELLVQEIAVCYWMERRAQLYENAQICSQSWPNTPDAKREPWKELGYNKGEDDWISDALDNDEGYMLLRRPDGVQYLINALAQLEKEVENARKNGNTKVERKAEQLIATSIEELAQAVDGYWDTTYENETYNSTDLLAEVDKEKEKLELLKKKLEEEPPKSRRRVPDFSHTALLLAPETLDLVQRYTAAHEKRRYRALAQLERLQRQRSGETIPPPIDVQITGDAGDFAKRSQ